MIEWDGGATIDLNASQSDGKGASPGQESEAVLIYSTFPSEDEAKKAGRALVGDGVAACVNIFPQMTSIYVWEGKVEEGGEAAMIVKTTRTRSHDALTAIKRLHPYSVPARLVLPVIDGGADFLAWIAQQCGRPVE